MFDKRRENLAALKRGTYQSQRGSMQPMASNELPRVGGPTMGPSQSVPMSSRDYLRPMRSRPASAPPEGRATIPARQTTRKTEGGMFTASPSAVRKAPDVSPRPVAGGGRTRDIDTAMALL